MGKKALLSLVEATGPASATYLKAVAKQAHSDKMQGRPVQFGATHVDPALAAASDVDDATFDHAAQEMSVVRLHMDEPEDSKWM